jgi:hypothetical protein
VKEGLESVSESETKNSFLISA